MDNEGNYFMNAEDTKEIEEIQQLNMDGMFYVLVAALLTLGASVIPQHWELTNWTLSAYSRIFGAAGFSNFYKAKGYDSNWSVLVLLVGIVGAIPYLFMKDLRKKHSLEKNHETQTASLSEIGEPTNSILSESGELRRGDLLNRELFCREQQNKAKKLT